MWAIVKEDINDLYKLKQVKIPEIKDDEVLIRVRKAGICGTDIPIIKGERKISLPMIPGHEFAGDIVGIGKDVVNLRHGERVTATIVISCGRCFYCRNNMESLCDNIVETGIHKDGAFAEYVALPERVVFKLPSEINYEEGASIDPIASSYHGIKKANPNPEFKVIIFGPGPIGLYALQILRSMGIKDIYVVGKNSCEKRLKKAKELGASSIINLDQEKLFEFVHNITDGKMADIVIDASNSVNGFQDRINVLRKNGKMITIGIPHIDASINVSDIVKREISIIGSMCYTREDFQECINLVRDKQIAVQPMISHRVKINDFGEGLRLIESGEALKVMVDINVD